MKWRIGGTEVYLSIGLLPFFFYAVVIGETGPLLCVVAALLLHECAHWIAAHNLGFRVTRLSLYPIGAVMRLQPLTEDARHEWMAAIAGPLGSLLAAAMTRLLTVFFPHPAAWLTNFTTANLVIAALNLLPAYPLDGGRIGKSALMQFVSEKAADRLSLAFSGTAAFSALGLGVLLLLRGVTAWTLFLLAPFFVLAAVRECRTEQTSPIRHAIERQATLSAGQTLPVRMIALHPSSTIGEALHSIGAARYTVFRVTDGVNAFEIEEGQLLTLAAKYGYHATFLDLRNVFDQSENTCYNKLFIKKPR